MCMPRSAQDFSMGCDYDIYYLVAKTIFWSEVLYRAPDAVGVGI